MPLIGPRRMKAMSCKCGRGTRSIMSVGGGHVLGIGGSEGVCAPCQAEGPLGCKPGKAGRGDTLQGVLTHIWLCKGGGTLGQPSP